MRWNRLVVLLACAATTGCEEVLVPNYNGPNVEQLTQAPTAKVVNGAVLGLLAGARGDIPGHALALGMLGRESLILDASNPGGLRRLTGPMNPLLDFQGDYGWQGTYRQLRGAYTILDVVDRVVNYTAEQKAAVRGVTKTFIAIAYIDQLRVRDTFGIVLDIDVTGREARPFVSRDSGFARAAAMLDEAKAHLNAAGSTFPFTLTPGFTGFTTPTTFIRFNRAIKARLEAYRTRWNDVLSALNESFVSSPATGATAALATGVFNSYATGEATHGLFQSGPSTLFGLPSFRADAQRRADGTPDLRASSKAQVVATSVTLEGVTSNVKITAYASNTANVPIIRNEELVLLRAEANIGLGNRAAAITDLNYVRVSAGGLPPLPSSYAGDLVDELLYNRRYSLFFEYGHRWVDLRRYNRLHQLEKMLPTHKVFPIVPFPQQECMTRVNTPKGCVTVEGI